MLKNLKIFSLVFLAMLFPYIKLGGGVLPTIYFIIFLPCFFYILSNSFKSDDFFLYAFFSISFLAVFIVGIFNGGEYSLRVLFLVFIFIFIYFSAKQILYFCLNSNIGLNQFYLIMINTILINSVLIILLNIGLIDPNVFYSYIETSPTVFTYPIKRYPGLVFDAFSYLSVLNAFTLCLLLDLYFKQKIKSNTYFLISFFVIFIALVLTGRSGILILILFFVFMQTNFNLRVFKITIFMSLIIVGVTLFPWGDFEWIKSWAFNFIINLVLGAEHIDSSVTGVQSLIFYPENIWLGDSTPFIQVKSDLGIIRFFNSLGLLGSSVLLLYYTFLFLLALRTSDKLSIFLVVMLFLLNFKDVYFVSPYGVTFFVLFIVLGRSKSFIHKGICKREFC